MPQNKNSLYRLYRPSTFNEVAGHKNVVQILSREIQKNNFPQALLFTGQRGTGKTSLARIFAKAINCFNRLEDSNPCDCCESCQANNEFRAPNIFEIDAASNNGVEEIRIIKENVNILPLSGLYKVYIIDEVHMLSKGAFNALLKTLEEPPKHVIFILATTEFAKIPSTIISRCQTFNLKKIDRLALENRLFEVAQKEGFVLEPLAAAEIYFLSDGSLRDALNYLEQLMMIGDQKISLANLQKIFYVASKKDKIAVLKNVFEHQPLNLIKYFEQALQKGLDFDLLALGLLEIIKEVIEFKLTNDSTLLTVLNLDELQNFNESLVEDYALADRLSEACEKTQGSSLNFNYLLINLLKLCKKQDEATFIEPKSEKTVFQKVNYDNYQGLQLLKAQLIADFSQSQAIEIQEQNIINLLVASSKIDREKIANLVANWFAVTDSQSGKFVNAIRAQEMIEWFEGKIIAASDCEVLMRFETESAVNYFQKQFLDPQYQTKMEQMLGKKMMVYPITTEKLDFLKKEFFKLKIMGALPVHQHQKFSDPKEIFF